MRMQLDDFSKPSNHIPDLLESDKQQPMHNQLTHAQLSIRRARNSLPDVRATLYQTYAQLSTRPHDESACLKVLQVSPTPTSYATAGHSKFGQPNVGKLTVTYLNSRKNPAYSGFCQHSRGQVSLQGLILCQTMPNNVKLNPVNLIFIGSDVARGKYWSIVGSRAVRASLFFWTVRVRVRKSMVLGWKTSTNWNRAHQNNGMYEYQSVFIAIQEFIRCWAL
ncbi:hypothetical protein BU17DRAFT_66201 [Hysterangium stoloniferum]|nr:hypothetical protein BU17DRAFT_66201 [Hysterangium stoloniferum]